MKTYGSAYGRVRPFRASKRDSVQRSHCLLPLMKNILEGKPKDCMIKIESCLNRHP